MNITMITTTKIAVIISVVSEATFIVVTVLSTFVRISEDYMELDSIPEIGRLDLSSLVLVEHLKRLNELICRL